MRLTNRESKKRAESRLRGGRQCTLVDLVLGLAVVSVGSGEEDLHPDDMLWPLGDRPHGLLYKHTQSVKLYP